MGYAVHKTNVPVAGVAPLLVTRFRWRAERRCKKLNRTNLSMYFRYKVLLVDGKWAVIAMQNVAKTLLD